MEFNSINFLVFFILVVTLYYSAPFRFRLSLLLIASLAFYGWWEPAYLGILLCVTFVTYLVSRLYFKARSQQKKKLLLTIGVGAVLVVLAFFKYSGFLAESVLNLCGQTMSIGTQRFLGALLPIGISFYSLQAMSYLVDVYNGRFPAVKKAVPFALYLSFFPQILAGPIERASNLVPQLTAPVEIKAFNIISGIKRMLWGYGCKVLIADKLAPLVDNVYGNVFDQNGLTLLLATYLFGFQIYFDFLGYTNIAIGAAKVLGIDLTHNFRWPYLAHSLRNFWHRWHITLSTWFRDYVYIPLGGSKQGHYSHIFAIASVFLLSGLWHGASWNFVLWGTVHGTLYVVEEYGWRRLFKPWASITSVTLWIGRFITFNLVMLIWLFFRAETLVEIEHVLKVLPSAFVNLGETLPQMLFSFELTTTQMLLMGFLLCGIFLLDATRMMEAFIQWPIQSKVLWYELIIWDLLLVLLLILGDLGGRQFVYFRF